MASQSSSTGDNDPAAAETVRKWRTNRKRLAVVLLLVVCGLWSGFAYLSASRWLRKATIDGDVGRARWAILWGADVEQLQQWGLYWSNMQPRWGWHWANRGATPLTFAAVRGNSQIVSLLLDAGADPNRIDEGTHGTPLAAAAFSGDLATVRLLLSAGAQVAPPGYQDNVLRDAAWGRNPAVVELLIDHGASLTAVDGQGAAPLHYAALIGDPDVVRVLLAKGADANQQNKQKKTAAQLAKNLLAMRRHEFERFQESQKLPSPFRAPPIPTTRADFDREMKPYEDVLEMLEAQPSAAPN